MTVKTKPTCWWHCCGQQAFRPNLALLDSGPGQDVNPELPGMGIFDHAIVYVPASEKAPELWIDATANYSKVGDLDRTWIMDAGRW